MLWISFVSQYQNPQEGQTAEMIQSQHCYVSESEYHMDMDKSKRVSIWSKAETDLTDDARGW